MNDASEEETVPSLRLTKSQLQASIIVFIITWSLALSLWYLKDMDKTILFTLNNANFSNTIAVFSKTVSRYGMSLIASINLILLLISFKDEKIGTLRPVFLLTILSFSIAGISGDILKQVFNRPRPIFTYAGELSFLTDSNTPAFPSGHATKSIALAIPLIFNNSEDNRLTLPKIMVLSTAILVCLSRVVLGAHYLSDVLAGSGWSVLCLPVSVFLTNHLLSKMTPERYEFASRIWILVYISLIILVAII